MDDLEVRDELIGPASRENGEPADQSSASDARALSALEYQQRLEDITRLVSDWIWETDRDFKFTYLTECGSNRVC
jgi:hypothetical protein